MLVSVCIAIVMWLYVMSVYLHNLAASVWYVAVQMHFSLIDPSTHKHAAASAAFQMWGSTEQAGSSSTWNILWFLTHLLSTSKHFLAVYPSAWAIQTPLNVFLSQNGLNALHLASKEGHVEVVAELLKLEAAVDAATKVRPTPPHLTHFSSCYGGLYLYPAQNMAALWDQTACSYSTTTKLVAFV